MCGRWRVISAASSAAMAMSRRLRRTRVGPFIEEHAVTLENLAEAPDGVLLRVEAGLMEMPQVVVDREAAGAAAAWAINPAARAGTRRMGGSAYASCGGVVVAVGAIEHGELVPGRVFNLPF